MGRLVAAVLLTCVLGSVFAGEPEPTAQTNPDTSNQQTRKSESTQVEKLIADGRRHLEKEDYAAAIEAFTQAIRNDDRNASAYRERARAEMYASGYYAKTAFVTGGDVTPHAQPERYTPTISIPQTALDDLKKAILLDPSDAEAHKLKGMCLNVLGDSESLLSFNEAVRLAPGDADAYYYRGLNLMGELEITKALADFTRAIELNPGSVEPLMARSMLRAKLGDFIGSLADVNAAIRLDDASFSAYQHRSYIYVMTGEYAKAHADCTTAIRLKSDNADAYSNRGSVNALLGQLPAAIADFSQALALDPQDYISYGYRADAYLEMGLFPKALADIDAAIELAPNVFQLRMTRAKILTKMDRPEEALRSRRKSIWIQQFVEFNKAVADGPEDPKNYQRRAVHYANDGQWKHALSDFNKALELEPESHEALLGRAKAWLKQGEFRKAVADCNNALQHSSHKEIYSVRGDAHFELHEYDEAIADYERAMSFNSTFAQAYWLRAQQRKAAGDEAAAAEDRQRALALDPSLAKTR